MRTAILTAIALAAAPAFAGQHPGPPPPGDPRPAPGGDSYVRPFEGAEFHALNPAMSPGAQMAVLWGDPKTGPSAARSDGHCFVSSSSLSMLAERL